MQSFPYIYCLQKQETTDPLQNYSIFCFSFASGVYDSLWKYTIFFSLNKTSGETM